MFSGIVEATATIKALRESRGTTRIFVEKPNDFNDLDLGDSVAVNGVCLTVESLEDGLIQFAVGSETSRVTGWTIANLQGLVVNLERSMRLGERIHGHIVSGHVDGQAVVVMSRMEGESWHLSLAFPQIFSNYIWRKGSVAINGVSLTINECTDSTLAVCLIPETLKRTNLGALKVGDVVNLEVDSYARGLVHSWR